MPPSLASSQGLPGTGRLSPEPQGWGREQELHSGPPACVARARSGETWGAGRKGCLKDHCS